MTVACPSLEPVDFDSLVNEGINRPARYMGHELGVEPRDWSTACVRWALTYPEIYEVCLLYTSPSPRDATLSRMPSSA